MNIKSRLIINGKLNYMFITLVTCTVLSAFQIDPTELTTWGAVCDRISHVVSNPFTLFTGIAALIAAFNDPKTTGLSDK